jgi:hypothetical protein
MAVLAGVLLLRFKVSSTWPLFGGALVGIALRHFLKTP